MSITSEFLRHPVRTGAIAASSPWLATAMTTGIGLERAGTVVELGPGTGAFTGAILARMGLGTKLTAVELNPRLAGELAGRYPRLDVLCRSAAELRELVAGPVDVVVSGLPWALMPHDQQREILDAVAEVLAPQGVFTTFAYAHAAWLPPARWFAAELAQRFGLVRRSPVVWPNLPPAFTYRATAVVR